ncbi:TetR/AcrR family transcriptional regulator [Micromonospora auratinigra]|uniref:Transcriptional regulator, TetR family n=1 Tax=Micromonospora auratinigra TaxID=261654 RepID=A0A1A8Z8L0_9ACTN|nr:TetR/AcrR family transcriptional regulator [Micromonospora auratinigra]SBT40134.1 transcriptional regulator, TetR family [Micromonospora auratinigra]
MPKLWNETIEAHRRAVHDAILDATVELAAEHGAMTVTMSQIAEKSGIGRATLYKYFPDVPAILLAWRDREIATHLARLVEARDRSDEPGRRLAAVLDTYAGNQRDRLRHHALLGPELGALLHRHHHATDAHRQVTELLRDLIADAARSGSVRADVPPAELATYCVHALHAAAALPSAAAVRRLVAVTLAGLRTP